MTYRVAAATSDGKVIDLHFGEIRTVLILEVKEEDGTYQEIEKRSIDEAALKEAVRQSKGSGGCHAVNDVFLDAIVSMIQDCTWLLTARIGNRPHRSLQQRDINCIEAPYPVPEAVKKLNQYYIAHKERLQHIF